MSAITPPDTAAPPPINASAINRHVWSLAVPAVGENLLGTVLLIIDTLMIAPFGAVPIAASAVAGTILWRAHMTLSGIEKGTTAIVARSVGEGDLEKVGRVVAQSIYLAILIGATVTAAGVIFATELFQWMKAAPDVTAVGAPYMTAIFCASIPRMLFFVVAGSLRGAGDTRSPMYITLWMNVVNLLFNYCLIYGKFGFPRLELLGSGIATALAILFAAGAVLWIGFAGRSHHFHLHMRHFVPDFRIMKSIMRIAIPSFAEEIITSVGFLAFTIYIARMGTSVLAAHQISSRIESLSFMAGVGFAAAAGTLVGQSLGMKSIKLARLSFHRSTVFCVLVMSAIAAMLILFGSAIVRRFASGDDYLGNLAFVLLMISAIEQPLLGIAMTLSGGIRGAGDTFSPMIVSAAGNILVRTLLSAWLAFGLGWGIYGIYIATVIDWIVRSALLFYFYRRGRWTNVQFA